MKKPKHYELITLFLFLLLFPLLNANASTLFRISKNGKWGYINKKGDIAIEAKYDMAFPFYEGLALVSQNGKFFHIDETGKQFSKRILSPTLLVRKE